MLKKKLGFEAIEGFKFLRFYYKIPSTLIIPEGCVRIGGFTFCDCNRLKRVIIPRSVERIGTNSFLNCKNLEKVVIPNSVKKIGDQAFWGCKNLDLEKVVIPKSVEVGIYSFHGCKDVKKKTRN